jgi:hypothetical protein
MLGGFNMRCNQCQNEVSLFFSIASLKIQNRYLNRNFFCAFYIKKRRYLCIVLDTFNCRFWQAILFTPVPCEYFVYLSVLIHATVRVNFFLFQSMDSFVSFFLTGLSFSCNFVSTISLILAISQGSIALGLWYCVLFSTDVNFVLQNHYCAAFYISKFFLMIQYEKCLGKKLVEIKIHFVVCRPADYVSQNSHQWQKQNN